MSKPGVRMVPRSPNSGHLVPKVVNMTSLGTPVLVNGLQTSGPAHFVHGALVVPVARVAPMAPVPPMAPVVSGPRHLRQPLVTYTVLPPRAVPSTGTTLASTHAVAPVTSPKKPRA